MINIMKKTLHVIKKNMVSLMLFCVCYHTAAFILVILISHAGLTIALKQVGYSYITTENIYSFLQEPLTIGVLGVLFIIIVFHVLFEIYTVSICCQAYQDGYKLRTLELFTSSVVRFFTYFRKSLIPGILVTCFLFPLYNLQLFGYLFRNVKILRYFVSDMDKRLPNHLIMNLSVVIFFIVGIEFVFILPYTIWKEQRSRNSVRAGFRIFQNNFIKVVFCYIVVNVLLLLILILFYTILITMTTVLISWFDNSSFALARLLKLSDGILFFVLALASIFGIILNSTLSYQMFLAWKSREEDTSPKSYFTYGLITSCKYPMKRLARIVGIGVIVAETIFMMNFLKESRWIVQEILLNTQVTSHRGGASVAPENTIAGIQYAINAAADYAELDVQETQDGVIVLLHDFNLKRTTGFNKYIWDTTYNQVLSLDAGTKFGAEYKGEKIPTLEEAAEYSKGKINLNIELKRNKRDKNFVEKVVQIIEDNHMENQCVITSAYYPYLHQIKECNPDLKTGYIIKVAYGNFSNRVDADFLSVKHTYVTRKLVKQAHNNGKEIYVWTVDSRSAMERMKQLEVDNIITDRPVTVKEVLASSMANEGFVTLLKYAFQTK